MQSGMIYSFNEGNSDMWDEPVQKYMNSLKVADNWGGKPYSVSAAHTMSLTFQLVTITSATCVGPWCQVDADTMLWSCSQRSCFVRHSAWRDIVAAADCIAIL